MKRLSLLLCIVLLVTICAGCGGSKETAGDEITKLTWYVRPTAQTDLQMVQDAANEIIREKIGAELEIIRIDPAAYFSASTSTFWYCNVE